MQLRGVNLGGWLILEKWITPTLFDGLQATDEYSFCLENPAETLPRLQRHRDTYITKQDFAWLAQHGINAVRLPVGYWALQDDPPFVACTTQLNNAFEWAAEYGMQLVLDLHGAPGSQNGQDHSGRAGTTRWNRRSNIQLTLDALTLLCERYGHHQALWGVELLNEPGWKISHRTLRNFYDRGYDLVRRHCKEDVAVIISDAFKPLDWNTFMADPKYQHIVLDTHLYQCFGPFDKALSLQGHVRKTRNEWGKLYDQIKRPVIVGEWSLGLDPKTFRGLNESQQEESTRSYASAQLEAFSNAAGWFFWTYKTETMTGWSFRACVEKSLIPSQYETSSF